MKDIEQIKNFISEKIRFQRNCFISYTGLKVYSEIGIPEKDEDNDLIFVNERGNITRDGCEYLLDKFSPEGERENLSWDKGYFKGYLAGMNDFLKFINTTK